MTNPPPPKSIAGGRPALTALCERALLRILSPNSLAASAPPLRTVPRRLLAVKVHGLGDSVMVRSIVEHFHRRHPSVKIGVLAGPANREVLTVRSNFHLHLYDRASLNLAAVLRTFVDIRRRHYQAVIDFEQGSLVGAAFIRATRIPVRVGFLPLNSSSKAAFLTHPLRFRETDSMWTSFVRLMRIIDRGFPETISATPIPIDYGTRRSVREWLRSTAAGPIDNVAAFHLGSGPRYHKRWPVERFVALANRLRRQSPNLWIILTGQPFEQPLIDEFLAGYSGPVIQATGLGSIAKVAALLAECDLLVSNDTGIMHLGAAMGTPTVGIFGPASPNRWAPVGPYAAAIAATGVPCSPCAEAYRLVDPPDCANPDRIRCLREVSVEMVLEAARRVTSARPQPRSNQLAQAAD